MDFKWWATYADYRRSADVAVLRRLSGWHFLRDNSKWANLLLIVNQCKRDQRLARTAMMSSLPLCTIFLGPRTLPIRGGVGAAGRPANWLSILFAGKCNLYRQYWRAPFLRLVDVLQSSLSRLFLSGCEYGNVVATFYVSSWRYRRAGVLRCAVF